MPIRYERFSTRVKCPRASFVIDKDVAVALHALRIIAFEEEADSQQSSFMCHLCNVAGGVVSALRVMTQFTLI